jgi:hypothetical protein
LRLKHIAMRKTLRCIVVKGRNYLWKREHLHSGNETLKCVERITIYLEGNKKSVLRLYFREVDNQLLKESWNIGYPDDGIIWRSNTDYICINLNKPAIIAKLIEYFLNNNWKPELNKPMIINDALKYLEIIDFPGSNN